MPQAAVMALGQAARACGVLWLSLGKFRMLPVKAVPFVDGANGVPGAQVRLAGGSSKPGRPHEGKPRRGVGGVLSHDD